jgi:hypothetical protein
MKWITREKIEADRVAWPQLIKNFIDRDAEFVFPPNDTDWQKCSDGTVFDVPNCELGQHAEDVSFNSLPKRLNVSDPALLLLAEIVRAADSHPANPHHGGESLRWIAAGFGRLGLTERKFVTYDVLFAECKHQNSQS